MILFLAPGMMAQNISPEEAAAKARFLAEHPAVARILNRPFESRVSDLSLKKREKTVINSSRPQRVAALPVLWCNVTGADSWSGRHHAYGVYRFNPVNNFNLEALKTDDQTKMDGNGGGVLIGDRYHITFWGMGMDYINSYHAVYDTSTWELISYKEIGDNGATCATDLAYDRINGKCYGAVFKNDLSGWELAELDFNGNIPTKKRVIGPLPLMVVALGVNSKGEIYGICEDGVLYMFDKENGTARRIGDTGMKVSSHSGTVQQSGAFDQHSDIFYWAVSDLYGNCALHTVNTITAETKKISDIPDRARLLNMQVLAPAAADKAPNYITDMSASFPQGSLTGNVSFTVPADTYDGTPMTGNLSYSIAVNDEVLKKGTCTPGQKIDETITVKRETSHFTVWVENEEGPSPTAESEFWTGVDIPVMKSVTYTPSGYTSQIAWTIDEKGVHGGYIGTPTYKITRHPDNAVLKEGVTQTSYTDVIPENSPLANYKYEVTPMSGGFAGEPMTSNGNVVGPALIPPYQQTFDAPESFDLLKVVDGNKDGYTWQWGEQAIDNKNGVASCPSNWEFSTEFDDWLLTPEIQLSADRTYDLTFKIRTTVSYGNDGIEVKYGEGDDVSKYISAMTLTRVSLSGDWIEQRCRVKSTKDQTVRIGFHRSSGYLNGTMKIDDISLSAGSAQTSPAPIENLEVIPDSKGALKAKVKFTSPKLDKSGNVLQGIDKIEVSVKNKVVKTYENPAPGESFECDVDVEKNGTYTFQVTATNFSGISDPVTVKTFVGTDVPAKFKAWMEDAGTHVAIKWEPVTTGANGYYINPDSVTYDIYNMQNGMLKDLIAGDLKGTEYIIPINTEEGKQGGLSFGMRAKNGAGKSSKVSIDIMIVGESFKLPYTEHWDGTSGYTYDVTTDQYFNIAGGTSSDDDGQCFAWVMTKNAAASKDLKTLKITLSESMYPRLKFDTKLAEGGKIETYVMTPDQNTHIVNTATDVTTGWSSQDIDLSAFRNERYIRVIFRFYKGTSTFDLSAIDNINIIDAITNDVEAEMSIPTAKYKYGSYADIKVKVTNKGSETTGTYKLSLYADSTLVETQTGKVPGFLESAIHNFSYGITPASPASIKMRAVVEHEGDLRAENDTTTGTLNVQKAKVSAPKNLVGKEENEDVKLSWTAPTEFYTEKVSEDFESYSPWTISNIGDWTLVDVDKAGVIGLDGADFPNEGSPQSFTIFNPSSIGIPAANTEATPHSGSQYLACFAAKIQQTEHNDDWIISPVLTGEAQTISFYAKQMIPNYGAEKLEVLYSKGSKETKDFVLAKSFEIDNNTDWKQFTVDLPADAQYFALRVVTRDGYICMIDDVTFTAGSCREITGWNIYRDGVFLEKLPLTQTTYTDKAGKVGMRYNVTALYATGEESDFSNDATIESGISYLFDNADAPFDIYSIDGYIIRHNASSIAGLNPGIYVIRTTDADGRTRAKKISVR